MLSDIVGRQNCSHGAQAGVSLDAEPFSSDGAVRFSMTMNCRQPINPRERGGPNDPARVYSLPQCRVAISNALLRESSFSQFRVLLLAFEGRWPYLLIAIPSSGFQPVRSRSYGAASSNSTNCQAKQATAGQQPRRRLWHGVGDGEDRPISLARRPKNRTASRRFLTGLIIQP